MCQSIGPIIGRIMPPTSRQDIHRSRHTLIPRVFEYVIWQKGIQVADGIKVVN